MSIQYDRGVLETLMEGLEGFHRASARSRNDLAADFGACQGHFNRLRDQLEALILNARRALESAEYDIRSAQAEYNAATDEASTAEEDGDRQVARARAQEAMAKLAQAQQEADRASAELSRQQQKLERLTAAWNTHSPAARQNLAELNQEGESAGTLVHTANRDLQQFMQYMEQARSDLYGTSGAAGAAVGATAGAGIAVGAAVGAASGAASGSRSSVSSGSAPGWCPKHSMNAVSVDSAGGKQLSLTIGGSNHSYSCDKNGLAQAYSAAVSAGDSDMVARISAMFEIETLREDLELESGDPAFAQLGGYHRDVRKQDPAGYESHHIPARSVQDEKADWLPTISITEADHSDTASYRGRQNHVHQLVTDPTDSGMRYKDNVSQRIARGGSGYIEALRNEIWDLRVCTGHRYDGGISGYLDAVIDMLATRGIPGNK